MSHLTPPRQLPDTEAGVDPDAPVRSDAAATSGDTATAKPAVPAEPQSADEAAASTDGEPGEDEGVASTGGRPAAGATDTRGPEAGPTAGSTDTPEPGGKPAAGLDAGQAAAEPDAGQTTAAGTGATPASDSKTAPAQAAAASDSHSAPSEAPPSETTIPETTPPSRPGWFGWRRRYPRAARAVRVGTSVLAGALVLAVLLVPNRLDRITVQSFFRLPVEAVFLAALLLVLPSKARRITAGVLGVLLGLTTILKCLDMGFRQTLARPFDLVFDWVLLSDAADFLKDSLGRPGEVLAVIGVIVLVVVVLAVSALAVVRLANVMARHRPVAVRTTLVLGVAWIICFTLGAQFGGVTLATKGYAQYLANRVQYVRDGLGDAEVFKKQLAVDAFADTPPDQLLTGLHGKDVMFTFIESYGRVAIDDPAMAPEIDATLQEGNARLKSAGFAARSGWLRSPVTGAGSWLAHSTFLSGLWIKNQQRYRTVTTSDRSTLTSYFKKTGDWRTVGIVPGVRKAWPEGKYFGLDHIYDSTHLGYQGPYFSWTPVPDQFSLEAFQKLEHGKKHRDPIMAEIILASSHNPWSPIAHTIDWKDLGDGKVFYKIKKEGTNPTEVWKSAKRVRTEYRKAIQYSLDSLTQWMQRYGDDNTVLVFLGDHQPVPTVTSGSTSRDVPVTIVARDPKVLDRVSDWGWTEGLKPAKNGPEWTMDKFRDRFMTAYGPQSG
ncbi:sulfatase [Streptomyces sp. NBC_00078]|uniref:sulfatase n=1 Tax=unclassified Streptomyces TaxID=2593676 RepID=UPI002254E3D8|nr:sulfatase [Streptomyces sp. NBC_00078]MCX5418614.1 sulfatase [Streptomyces sp. NBC_00078]